MIRALQQRHWIVSVNFFMIHNPSVHFIHPHPQLCKLTDNVLLVLHVAITACGRCSSGCTTSTVHAAVKGNDVDKGNEEMSLYLLFAERRNHVDKKH